MCIFFLDLLDLLYHLKKENEFKRKFDFIASTSLHKQKDITKNNLGFLVEIYFVLFEKLND